jgi:hypothetical protein
MVERTIGIELLGPSATALWGLTVKPGAQDSEERRRPAAAVSSSDVRRHRR